MLRSSFKKAFEGKPLDFTPVKTHLELSLPARNTLIKTLQSYCPALHWEITGTQPCRITGISDKSDSPEVIEGLSMLEWVNGYGIVLNKHASLNTTTVELSALVSIPKFLDRVKQISSSKIIGDEKADLVTRLIEKYSQITEELNALREKIRILEADQKLIAQQFELAKMQASSDDASSLLRPTDSLVVGASFTLHPPVSTSTTSAALDNPLASSIPVAVSISPKPSHA